MPILYGLPTPAAMRAASAGRVRLAGCVMTPDQDQWACAAGHEWRAGDDAQLGAAIQAAIRAAE
ncbi:hypothetical protein [Kribbella antibiotica]|uniref:hypothetical protein n=1 Tax=Kribbella antibiotica TaxID=190195 RepID=UPI00192E1222|nr:hypothetical protein [Kribbella antibiotica]